MEALTCYNSQQFCMVTWWFLLKFCHDTCWNVHFQGRKYAFQSRNPEAEGKNINSKYSWNQSATIVGTYSKYIWASLGLNRFRFKCYRCAGGFFVLFRDKHLDQDSASHAFGAATEPSIASFTRRAIMLKNLHHYFENHRQQIVYLFIFFSICALLFAERFYSQSTFYTL